MRDEMGERFHGTQEWGVQRGGRRAGNICAALPPKNSCTSWYAKNSGVGMASKVRYGWSANDTTVSCMSVSTVQ